MSARPDEQPPTYVGLSDDLKVEAVATAAMRVAVVTVEPGIEPEQAGEGIVQAVNRALDRAQDTVPSVDEVIGTQTARATEFSSLIDGFEAEVSRTAARMADRE